MTTLERIAPTPSIPSAPKSDGPLPAACDARIATLFHYWQMKRPAPDALPGRQHIWLRDITGLLRSIWLCDVERMPLRFRYRLIGSTISYEMSRDFTGAWLDEAHEGFMLSPAYADFLQAVETRRGAYYKGAPLFHLQKDYLWMERLLLPLARDGREVDMILGITVYGTPASPRIDEVDDLAGMG
jgi:hypothetical protein